MKLISFKKYSKKGIIFPKRNNNIVEGVVKGNIYNIVSPKEKEKFIAVCAFEQLHDYLDRNNNFYKNSKSYNYVLPNVLLSYVNNLLNTSITLDDVKKFQCYKKLETPIDIEGKGLLESYLFDLLNFIKQDSLYISTDSFISKQINKKSIEHHPPILQSLYTYGRKEQDGYVIYNPFTQELYTFSFSPNISSVRLINPCSVTLRIINETIQNKFNLFYSTKNIYAQYEIVTGIADLLRENLNIFEVHLVGIDPLLHPEIEYIINYCNDLNVVVTITTYIEPQLIIQNTNNFSEKFNNILNKINKLHIVVKDKQEVFLWRNLAFRNPLNVSKISFELVNNLTSNIQQIKKLFDISKRKMYYYENVFFDKQYNLNDVSVSNFDIYIDLVDGFIKTNYPLEDNLLKNIINIMKLYDI